MLNMQRIGCIKLPLTNITIHNKQKRPKFTLDVFVFEILLSCLMLIALIQENNSPNNK